MKSKTVFIFFLGSCAFASAVSSLHKKRKYGRSSEDANVMDVADFSVYYDLETNQTIRDLMPRPWYRPGWSLRLPFTGGKCKCEGPQCSCCTGIRMPAFNFDRKTCALLTYEQTSAMIDLEVMVNNDSVYRNTFPATNPPPFCVPIPVPYLPPGLFDMCIRLFDVNLVMDRLHVCMDMDTRIDKAPVLVLHFDCMDMGAGGVSLSKPSNHTLADGNITMVATAPQLDSDVFDPVTDNLLTTPSMFNNSIKYI